MTAQQVEGVRIQVVEVSSHPSKLAGYAQYALRDI